MIKLNSNDAPAAAGMVLDAELVRRTESEGAGWTMTVEIPDFRFRFQIDFRSRIQSARNGAINQSPNLKSI